jgi:hypothetical protein
MRRFFAFPLALIMGITAGNTAFAQTAAPGFSFTPFVMTAVRANALVDDLPLTAQAREQLMADLYQWSDEAAAAESAQQAAQREGALQKQVQDLNAKLAEKDKPKEEKKP